MSFSCTLVAIVALSLTQAESVSLNSEEYLARLELVSHEIANAGTRREAHVIAAVAGQSWTVRTDDAVVVVDLRWLDGAIDRGGDDNTWPSARQDITNRLDTMRAELSGPRVDHKGALDTALTGVLARPEFQQSQTALLMDAARRRVTEWIANLFSRVFGRTLGSRDTAVRLAWIVALVALVALTGALVTLLARRSRAERLTITPALPPRAAAREWALRALRAMRAGDLREATRCGYRAALCKLDEQGIWEVDDSRTPREYLRLLRSNDSRRPAVTGLTHLFEQVWYAGRLTTDDDARRLTEHLETLGCVRAADRAI